MVDFSDREEVFAEVIPNKPMRPAKVTVIAVVGIILAVILLLGCMGSMPGILMQAFAPDAFSMDATDADPQLKAQIEMQEKMAEVTRNHLPLLIGLTLFSFLMGVSLMYGSIQSLRKDEAGTYRFLANVCLVGIIYTLINAVATTMLQMANWHAMEQALMTLQQNDAKSQMFRTIMYYSIVVGLIFGLVYQLGQLIYFSLGKWILSYHASTLASQD
ncbi:hypothetical protein [Bremerella sp. JC817]|uniref:hypothetical protein n=1 Tax=Bremerella sp. JC817 TaxID=3231756 RepID=UPI003457C4F1